MRQTGPDVLPLTDYAALMEPPAGTFPFRDMIGYRMTELGVGHARFELELETRHMNGDGVPHGGLYAVLLDTALGFTGALAEAGAPRRPAVTLSLQVSFLAPPRGGKRLVVLGRKTGGGSRVYFAEGQVMEDGGAVLATGSGVFRYRSGAPVRAEGAKAG